MTITTKPILKTCANGARVFNPSCHARLGRVKNPCSIRRCLFYAAILGAVLCHAQTNVVYYGANTNALNVVFADTALSVTNQSLIVADLNLCLLGLGKIVELHFYEQEIDGKIGYLRNPKRRFVYSFFPRDIVATPNGHALRISQDLSDDYTNAFVFAAAHSNIVAAAYELVEFLSSPDFVNLPASDWPNYYLDKIEPDTVDIANAQRNISWTASCIHYPPSILNFGYYLIGPEHGPGTINTNLLTAIPFVRPPPPNNEWNIAHMIWHDGRWKFLDYRWFEPPPLSDGE